MDCAEACETFRVSVPYAVGIDCPENDWIVDDPWRSVTVAVYPLFPPEEIRTRSTWFNRSAGIPAGADSPTSKVSLAGFFADRICVVASSGVLSDNFDHSGVVPHPPTEMSAFGRRNCAISYTGTSFALPSARSPSAKAKAIASWTPREAAICVTVFPEFAASQFLASARLDHTLTAYSPAVQ